MGYSVGATASISGGRIVYICVTVFGALVALGSVIAHFASKNLSGWGWGLAVGLVFFVVGGILLGINIGTDGRAP